MLKNELQPCPFCGTPEYGQEKVLLRVASNSKGQFAVLCQCGATGPIVGHKEEAATVWNARGQLHRRQSWNPFQVSRNMAPVDLRGSVKSLRYSTLLQMLSSENKSGILEFSRGQTQIALCLKDGKIIAASGNGGLRLGQLLYDKRLITQERLQEALEKASQSGRRVGEVLLDLGYVSEDELRDLIHHQIREAVLDLSLWGEGEFTYQECQVEFDKRGVEDINTMGLILEAARVIDEWAANQKM